VVQVGTQNRSNKLYIHAKEMYEQGMIVKFIHPRLWYRNFENHCGRFPPPGDT